jgi:hypothetical protein
MTKPVKPVSDICELEQFLPARGNIRAFLPRRRVAELVWIWAQVDAIKTGQTGQSQIGQSVKPVSDKTGQ